jgi:adenylate kinase family enzyme
MIVIGGFAGSGKSTLAKKLGNILSIPVFEIDHLARSIRESKDFHGENSEAYGITFDLFFSFARSHLKNGCSLILDQNMGHAMTWEAVRKLRDSLSNIEVKIFVLECPYELCVTRFALRTEHPNLKEVTVEDLADHKYKWDYLNENELPDAIRIDATREPDDVLKEVLIYFDAQSQTGKCCQNSYDGTNENRTTINFRRDY